MVKLYTHMNHSEEINFEGRYYKLAFGGGGGSSSGWKITVLKWEATRKQ